MKFFNGLGLGEACCPLFTSLHGSLMTGAKRVFNFAIFLFVAFGALLLVMTSQWLESQREQMVNEAALRNQTRVATFEQFTLRMLESAQLSSDYVWHEVEHQMPTDESELREIFQGAIQESGVIDAMYGNVGSIRTATDTRLKWGAAIERRLIENFDATGRDKWLSPPVRLNGEPKLAFISRSPLVADDYVIAFLSPDVFTKNTHGEDWAEGELISLIGLDGITRARRNGNRLSSGENLSGKLVMQKQMASPNGTYEGLHSINQTPYIFSHRRIPDYHLFVTSGMRSDRYLAPLTSDRLFAFVVMLVAAILGITALYYLRAYLQKKQGQFEAVEAANRRLNQAQSLGNMGDWVYDVETGIFALSENLRRIYGWDRRDVAHLDLTANFDLDHFSKLSGTLEHVKDTKQGKALELKACLPNGELSHRRLTVQPELNSDGEVIKIYGIDQSIDDEKNLLFLRSQAAALARLQSMSALTATLAHEVNQPLTVISNYLSVATRMLQKSDQPDRQVTMCLRKANHQVSYLGEMIGAARDLVSQSDKNTEIYPLDKTFDEALALLEADSAYNVSVISVIGCGSDRMVFGRRLLVKQVIYNLLKNALEITKNETAPCIHVLCKEKSDWLEISIEDNGPGFSDSVQPFEAFSTSRPGGMGLGLALCRTIVEAQGGRIWATNTDNSGAKICFTLPLARDAKA